MSVLDVFATDAFKTRSLTNSMMLMPYKPSLLGSLGLFEESGVPTTNVMVEEKAGLLSLIPSQPRGAPARTTHGEKRTARSFAIPHLPLEDVVMADDVQNVRAFGSENQLEGVVQVVNDKLQKMRQEHEVTLEYHRIGACNGVILDADGTTTIYNLFTEFGVVEQTMTMELDQAGTDVAAMCSAALRLVEGALGNAPYTKVLGLCGDAFWDLLIGHASTKAAYANWSSNSWMRADNRAGFDFGGITWMNYRGAVSGVTFQNTDNARLVPLGVPGLLKTHFGPADFVEAVNTIGLPVYAKQERLPLDRGILLHTQSNPLCLCHIPRALVKLTKT